MELLSWCSFELPLIFVGFAGSAKSPRQCTFKITRKAKPGSVRAYRRWGCFIWAESVQAKVGCFLAYKNIFCRSTGQILCRKIGPKLGPMMLPLPSVSSGAPWFGLPCYFGSVSLRWFGTLTTKKASAFRRKWYLTWGQYFAFFYFKTQQLILEWQESPKNLITAILTNNKYMPCCKNWTRYKSSKRQFKTVTFHKLQKCDWFISNPSNLLMIESYGFF